jgi:hypothetical protein
MSISRARAVQLGTAALLCAPVSAIASPLDLFGGSPEGISLNSGLTAWSEDGMATYFNPAGLGVGGSDGKAKIQLNYMYEDPSFYIQRFNHNTSALMNYPTAAPVKDGFVVGSLLVPIGSLIKHKASIGVFFAIPQDGLLSTQALEPSNPQLLRYGTDFDRITVGAGLGVRPIKQLSLGIGVQEFAAFAGSNTFTVNETTMQLTNRDITFSLKGAAAPIAGVTFKPDDRWTIAASYRGPIDLGITLPDSANITGIGPLNIGATGTVLYSPHTISLGVKVQPIEGLTVGLDVRYELWSLAPVPDFDLSINGSGILQSIVDSRTAQPNIPFNNTITPTAAAQYTFCDHMFTIRGAYSYRPTYVPQPGFYPTGTANQPADENYLDTNAHIVGICGSIHVPDRIHLFPEGIDFDLAVQTQILPRTNVSISVPKDQADPVGPLAYGGADVVVGGGLHFQF